MCAPMATGEITASITVADRGRPAADVVRRWWPVVAALAMAAGALTLKATTDGYDALDVLGDAFCGLTLLFTSAWALTQDRDRRLGTVLALAAFAWFAEDLVLFQDTVLKLVGELTSSASLVPLAYLALTFPTARLHGRASRWAIGVVAVHALVLIPAKRIFWADDAPDHCRGWCDWRLHVPTPFYDTFVDVVAMTGAAAAALVLVLLVRRYAHASRPLRRYIGPFMWCALAITVLAGIDQVLRLVAGDASRDGIVAAENVLTGLLALGFPIGLLRMRMTRAAAAGMVLELADPGTMQSPRTIIARALGDPDVDLVLFDDGPVGVAVPPHRVATPLVAEGRTLGMLVHDATLEEAAGLVPAAASALSLRLENERLKEAQAALADVADDERRRLERDLHDGAQQRIVALTMTLAGLRDELAAAPELQHRLAQVEDGLRDAIEELRSLARGMHPRALEDGGLGVAVRALAARTPMRVVVRDDTAGRLPADVEITAYYVICEALANAGKHAGAHAVDVHLREADDALHCVVRDDGAGGARTQPGGGLAGLRARVLVRGGALEVDSPPGGGTELRVRVPLGDRG